jgi:hypothetical protein
VWIRAYGVFAGSLGKRYVMRTDGVTVGMLPVGDGLCSAVIRPKPSYTASDCSPFIPVTDVTCSSPRSYPAYVVSSSPVQLAPT